MTENPGQQMWEQQWTPNGLALADVSEPEQITVTNAQCFSWTVSYCNFKLRGFCKSFLPITVNQYILVLPKVDQRADQLSLPNVTNN